MGAIHPAERYPGWALQLIFLAAVWLVLAAILIGAGMLGRPAEPVMVIHCLVNALVLLAVWNEYRDDEKNSVLVPMVAQPLSFGLGAVDFFLAGQAAAQYRPETAMLLMLFVPGAAGVVVFYLNHLRKKTPEETAVEDQAVLAREAPDDDETDGEPLTFFAKLKAYGAAVIIVLGWMGSFLGSLWLSMVWYRIVWRAVGEGVSTGVRDIALTLWETIRTNWATGARLAAMLVILITLSLVWGLLAERWKRFRYRRKPADSELDARTDAALRAVYDYANRPQRPAKNLAVYGVPFVLFGLWIFTLGAYDKIHQLFAVRIFETRQGAPGWHVVYGAGDGFLFVFFGAVAFLAMLWCVLIGLWPGAAEAVVTLRYRRSAQALGTSIETLRYRLTKRFKRHPDKSFDPRGYLLERHRRFTRWVYGIAGLVVAGALLGIWSSLNSYTVFTNDGLIERHAFAPDRYLAWREVRAVEIRCVPHKRNDAEVVWIVTSANGRTADLIDGDDVDERLPALRRVDAILRAQAVDFGRPVPPTREGDACLESAGRNVRDFPAFLRVMHRD